MQLAFDGELDLYISSYVIAELRETATRPKVAAKLRVTAERAEEFIESVELAATLLEGVPETFTFERNPDDALRQSRHRGQCQAHRVTRQGSSVAHGLDIL
jgi:predicted nucleic acid-binding protein